MTELEKIEYAKTFIDKLANGINPLDDSPISEGDVVNNVRLSRCFFYVSDVLRQVIENGGIGAENKENQSKKQSKSDFNLTDEARNRITVASHPMTVKEIAEYLNNHINAEITKKISPATINDWLVSIRLLEVSSTLNGKSVKMPTEMGKDFGIFVRKITGPYGTRTAIMHSPSSQQFLYDNIDALIVFNKERKTSGREFKGKPWTEEQEKCLIDLFNNNVSISEIARTLKRTSGGIRARLKRLGLIER